MRTFFLLNVVKVIFPKKPSRGLPAAGAVARSRDACRGPRGAGSRRIAPSRSAVARGTPAGQGAATHYLAITARRATSERKATVERCSLRRQYCHN